MSIFENFLHFTLFFQFLDFDIVPFDFRVFPVELATWNFSYGHFFRAHTFFFSRKFSIVFAADHNLDAEKEFFTPKNTIWHVPHLYRTGMENSYDTNSEKWQSSCKWRNCKKVHRWNFVNFVKIWLIHLYEGVNPKIRVGQFFFGKRTIKAHREVPTLTM